MRTLLIGVLIAGLLLPNVAGAQKSKTSIPDFTRGDSIPKTANHDWNLGPTGTRGWIYSNGLETTQARQIRITKVDKGSPSDGVLNVGDVILGVGGKKFSYDPRPELGKAITKAEANNGKLFMTRWRDGKTKKVAVQLKVMGSYSATAPFDCEKSKRILEQGCEALAKKMQARSNAPNQIVRSLNTLALLSCGDEKYMPIIRKQVAWASKYSDVEGKSLCCWFYGPINMLLAEYTLATGDRTYVGELERITMEIVGGQSAVGTWGHRFSRDDGRLNGYGMMNAPGLPMTASLVLAREAGVNNAKLDNAIEMSTRLMRFYVGKGCVPYGDHAPWMKTHDDNGKNGIAALLFNMLQDGPAAEYYSRMSVAAYGNERELGHTGNFFNLLWAMPAVALSGPNASGAWMQEYGWYYDLARRWDGTFQHQGAAQARADRYNNWDATSAFMLAYAQPRRKLFITGKRSGVVTQVDADTAASLIEDGRGFSHREPKSIYADKSKKELIATLSSWSPVVRERAAVAISRRKGDYVPQLLRLLQSGDKYSQLGACQCVAQLKNRAARAVPQLQKALSSDDLWVRVNAAQALAAIGDKARVAIPQMLTMLKQTDAQTDPRAMQQRFLCFALFDQRNGLLKGSLEGIDKESLYEAVRAGLENEDGRARGSIASVYRNLSYEEIEPLLPAIYAAVVKSAPSGMMFADGIRLAGLEILAKHRIKEGLPLCVDVMELDRWGSGKRISKCLTALQLYGTAAKDLLPQLESIQRQMEAKKENKKVKQQKQLLRETIFLIGGDEKAKKLRSLQG